MNDEARTECGDEMREVLLVLAYPLCVAVGLSVGYFVSWWTYGCCARGYQGEQRPRVPSDKITRPNAPVSETQRKAKP